MPFSCKRPILTFRRGILVDFHALITGRNDGFLCKRYGFTG